MTSLTDALAPVQRSAIRFGLRARLLVLVAIAATPALAFIHLEYERQRAESEVAIQAELQQLTRMTASRHDLMLAGTRDLLSLLARQLAVDRAGAAACSPHTANVLAAAADETEHIANVILFDRDGNARCASRPEFAGIGIADRDFFQQVLRTEAPTVGRPVHSRFTGEPVLPLLYPIRDADGTVQFVVSVSLSYRWFAQTIGPDLKPDIVFTAFDGGGLHIVRVPDRPEWEHRRNPVADRVLADLPTGEVLPLVDAGYDGIERLWAIKRLALGPGSLALGFGYPQDLVVARADALRRRSYITLAASAALAALLMLAGGHGMIVRRVRALIRAAERVQAGDTAVRVGLKGRDEIARLGEAFDLMTATLARQSTEADKARRRLEDETERRRELLETLRAVIDASPVAIIGLGIDRKVMIWSQAAERISGFAAAEVVGGPYPLVPADERAEADRLFDRAFAGEVLTDVEVRRQRRDGTPFDIRFSCAPLHDAQGAIRGVIYAVEDITQRKRARENLRKSNELLNAIVGSSPLGIYVLDAEGKVTLWNAAAEKIFGYSAAEATGRLPPFVDVAALPEFRRNLAVAQDAAVAGIEARRRRKDGSPVDISIACAALSDERSGLRGTVNVVMDVTARKQLEQQLRQAQKMEAIGNLTGGLAHDFNNLLTVVIGNLDLLRDQVGQDLEATGLVDTALDAGLRGADLTRRLLAFARRQPLEPKPTDVNELMTGMTRLLSRTLGEDIRIELQTGPDLWPVVVDSAQLGSAIANLATNARDAMPNGGTLTIETRNTRLDAAYAAANPEVAPGDYVAIAIADTGTGMDAETLAHAFEPFFTTKKAGKGTGLGLSMVFGFVRQSQGHVKICSEVGRGTTIRIYLPRATDGLVAVAPADADSMPHGRETILLVEDKADVRDMAFRQLTDLSYRVIAAEDGDSAVKIIDDRQVAIDLLFTDIVMPGAIDGRALARIARERRPGIKVLFTSGYPGGSPQASDPPAADERLLGKPYRRHELARKLREALDQ